MARIKKPRLKVKKVETVRERAEKQRIKQTSQPRRKKVAAATAKPVKGIGKILTKEFHPIKFKKNGKLANILSKRVRYVPKYFKASFAELKEVQWLKPRQALSLTFAVVIFSVVIAVFVQLLGYGFDKIVKEVILK